MGTARSRRRRVVSLRVVLVAFLAVVGSVAGVASPAPTSADPLSDPCEVAWADELRECTTWGVRKTSATLGWVAAHGGRVYMVGSFVAAVDEATGEAAWVLSLGGGSAALSPDGTTLYMTRRGTLESIILFAISTADGSVRWSRTYADSRLALGSDTVAVSADSASVYVGAEVINRGFASATMVVFDSAGNQRWTHLFDPAVNPDNPDAPVGIAATSTAAYVALSRSGVYRFDAATGTRAWRAGYTGTAGPGVHDMAFDAAGGRVFVINGWSSNIGVEAFDAGTGAALWGATFDGPAISDFDYPSAIAVSPDGTGVYATGSSRTLADVDFVVLAYDAATGGSRWVGRYAGFDGTDDHPDGLAVSADGARLVVTGESRHFLFGPYQTCTTAGFATATGAVVWSARFQGTPSPRFPAFDSRCPAVTAGATPSRFVVAGAYRTASGFDAFAIAYDR